jgi:hypothetical protein
MPNWSTSELVSQTIRAGDQVEFARGRNRTLINKAANNDPLMDEEEAKRVGMKIYNRWGEFMITLANASRQGLTNFTSQDTYFTVSVPKAPEEIRADMSGFITETINELMKDGSRQMEYFMVHFSKWKAWASHGIAPMMWEDKYNWIPRTVAIEDLRIPTDTEVSFRNLVWFGVRISYTPGELSRKAFSKVKSKWKWNKKSVASILKNIEECNTTMAENNYSWDTQPEKFEELRKQNAGYWSGDAMPTISLWHFYHQDDDKKWRLKIVPDTNASGNIVEDGDDFICQSQGAIADSWRQILHVQFGDLNNKTPLLYHSVRSLGFSLFEPCYWTDFTRCRLLQHTLDQFNILLRVTDPIDKARAQIQVFQNLGVVKPGVSFIPAAERWEVDAALPESTLSQLKQLQAEASTSYTSNIDNGTAREQTAFEVGVKVQQNNSMLSGMMLLAKAFEKTASQEICRRFCLKGTDDEDAIAFQKMFKDAGYPIEWLDVKKWRIEINMPLGNGNPTMAMVESQNMLQLRALADPESQQEMAHDAAVQMIGTSRAKRFFNTKKNIISDSANAAANAFPLMMLGLPPQIPEGLNPIQQIKTLLGLCGGYIAKIEQTTKVPSMMELGGLQNVAAYLMKLVSGMKNDTANAELYKEFSQELSQLNNEIKKLAAQLNSSMQKNGNGMADETQAKVAAIKATTAAKIESQMETTKAKLKQKELGDIQKARHKEQGFIGEQGRKDVQTVAEVGRAALKDESQPSEPPAE